MTTHNWGILGTGTIASEFATMLREKDRTIYSVGSRTQAKADDFANQHGVTYAHGSYDSFFQDEQIDIVYIATPHSNHYELIERSLQQGKHVLCEKAITVNGAQLKKLMKIAIERSLILMEAMTIYHMPLYKKIKDKLVSGEMGALKMIHVTFGSYKDDDANNRFFNPELAGGALLDIGTYALSFTRFFLSSQPTEIQTMVKPFHTGVDEQSTILLRNDLDEMATVSLAFRAKMPKRGMLICEKGFIHIDDFPRAVKAVVTVTSGATETIETSVTTDALRYEAVAMEQAILTGKPAYLQLSKDVMDLMDRIRHAWGISSSVE
ncbi:putative dehydrogenase [Alkalihalobacillus xiaoxiensis]|uniref:Dehydrogenase n=1 Tax=Shouchella xiaoxiensis TaxID=766895 RepID=A0ABS2T185_9BACI|nr:Gfo/Idh/MocA family oxidoreductase [Shouchella xiaoxiensis]MBM7841216.1 putative dehydrogenase [Shouchella xiaoxiensis]